MRLTEPPSAPFRAFITFENDEVVVRWINQEDFAKHEIRMPDLSKKHGSNQIS
jgi:hypothetical protein